jgi:hypothetical protein
MRPILNLVAAIAILAPLCACQMDLSSIKKIWGGGEAAADAGPQTVECPRFEAIRARQQQHVWCWAACAEMVYRYRGQTLLQQEIAARIHGHKGDGEANVRAASVYEVLIALAGADGKADRADRFLERYNAEAAKAGKKGVKVDVGAYASAWIEQEIFDTDEMIEELRNKQPVVIGMAKDPRFEGGHAMVVYSATYKPAQRNTLERAVAGEQGNTVSRVVGIRKYEVVTLKVMDPWTGEAREMEGKELSAGCDFMMSQRRAAAVLKKQDEAIKAAG